MPEYKEWLTLKVATNHLQTELLEQELTELGADGIETVDKEDFATLLLGPDSLDYASGDFIESLPDVVNVRAFFALDRNMSDEDKEKYRCAKEEELKSAVERLNEYLPIMLESVYEDINSDKIKVKDREPTRYTGYEFLADEDWSKSWREFYKPVDLKNGIVVCPSWIDHKAKTGDTVIRLDPGGAFGTGHHETTQLCLKELPDLVVPGCHMLDVGTGSGILAIASRKLGAIVDAVDLDPNAIKVAKENCENNQVAVNLLTGSINRAPRETYDLIVTNITAKVLIELAPELYKRLSKAGYILVSGVTVREKELVKKSFLKEGFEYVKKRSDGEWVAIVFRPAEKL